MVTKEQIDRINVLAKKKKTEGLTEAEQAEQKVLYRAYIDAFKANLRAQLENIEIIDDDTQEVEKIEEEVEALEETLQEGENRLEMRRRVGRRLSLHKTDIRDEEMTNFSSFYRYTVLISSKRGKSCKQLYDGEDMQRQNMKKQRWKSTFSCFFDFNHADHARFRYRSGRADSQFGRGED